ncbi:hypothetical protein B0O80DRAFT_499733 [Mortierella sp. GBAus27b]|nr:hypothetical protein B0O80DRAFT_499733 [Mortierella sp. GBAus27b]
MLCRWQGIILEPILPIVPSDSSPNSSTENLATGTQSIIVTKSYCPSSLNPNPRHPSYRHSSNNLNDAKNAADADAKKQTEPSLSMVGKSKERMFRTTVSELTDPNYQKPSTRSRLKAAAALVTLVQIPKTPLETRKSLMSPLSAGPVLMTPRSSSLANMAATPAPVAVPTTPTLASPPIVNPKLVKKALKTRSRTALPGSMDATEEMRLRSRSMTSLTQVTGTSMDSGLERSKTHMYRTSSSSPSSPATTCPPTFGDVMMKAQLVQRRRPREMQFPVQMRGDPNCTRCHGHGFIREPELPELLDVSLIPSLNQAPIPSRPINHQGSSSGGFVPTFKIIREAKNIVVLRIDEADHGFALSVPDLRLRVQKKLAKMDIPSHRNLNWSGHLHLVEDRVWC